MDFLFDPSSTTSRRINVTGLRSLWVQNLFKGYPETTVTHFTGHLELAPQVRTLSRTGWSNILNVGCDVLGLLWLSVIDSHAILSIITEPRHEKRDTNDVFLKTETLMPPDWYYYWKHSAEILEPYLSSSWSYAIFRFTWTIRYILPCITLIGRRAKWSGCPFLVTRLNLLMRRHARKCHHLISKLENEARKSWLLNNLEKGMGGGGGGHQEPNLKTTGKKGVRWNSRFFVHFSGLQGNNISNVFGNLFGFPELEELWVDFDLCSVLHTATLVLAQIQKGIQFLMSHTNSRSKLNCVSVCLSVCLSMQGFKSSTRSVHSHWPTSAQPATTDVCVRVHSLLCFLTPPPPLTPSQVMKTD